MVSKTEAVLNQLRTGEQQAALRQAQNNKVSTERVLDTLKVKREVAIDEEYFIPNHSGNLSAGKVLITPTEDLQVVNKAYVDAQIGGGNPLISSGSGSPVSIPSAVGAVYIDTANSIFYVAMGTSSSNDWKAVLTE